MRLQPRGIDLDLDNAHDEGDGRQNRDDATPLDPPPDRTGTGGAKRKTVRRAVHDCSHHIASGGGAHLADSLSRYDPEWTPVPHDGGNSCMPATPLLTPPHPHDISVAAPPRIPPGMQQVCRGSRWVPCLAFQRPCDQSRPDPRQIRCQTPVTRRRSNAKRLAVPLILSAQPRHMRLPPGQSGFLLARSQFQDPPCGSGGAPVPGGRSLLARPPDSGATRHVASRIPVVWGASLRDLCGHIVAIRF